MNELIDRAAVGLLVRVLTDASPGMSWTNVTAAGGALDHLSLRGRTDHVSQGLLADIAEVAGPQGKYPTAARIFRRALKDADFTGWTLWPVTETAVTLALDSSGVRRF